VRFQQPHQPGDGSSGADRVIGSEGVDFIHGLAGPDQIDGETGRDSLGGGAGRDDISAGPGRDYLQGGPQNDALDGDPHAVRDTLKGGEDGSDLFYFDTTEDGPDRILDFNEGGTTPGDFVRILDVTTAQLQAMYSASIEAADPGVTNVNGNLVIDFIPVSGPAGDTLTFTGLGGQSLALEST
jgi:Ca2+-binding RTX toxin-like protein